VDPFLTGAYDRDLVVGDLINRGDLLEFGVGGWTSEFTLDLVEV
jgi:hypothetical protein